MIRVGRGFVFALGAGFNAVQLHQLAHTLFTYRDATYPQRFPDPGPSIFLLGFRMNGLDMHQERIVADMLALLWRRLSCEVLVIAALTYSENFAL